jgi:hypothetical protein
VVETVWWLVIVRVCFFGWVAMTKGQERTWKWRYLLARRFIQHNNATFFLSQERPRNAEQLPLAVREVQVFNLHVERMRIPVHVAFADHNIPEVDVFERLHNGLVAALLQGVRIEADGSGEQVGVLGEADEARANLLARDAVDRVRVDCDASPGELDHAEEGEDEGGFSAVEVLAGDVLMG